MNFSLDRTDFPFSAFLAGKKRLAIKVEDVDLVAWKIMIYIAPLSIYKISFPSPDDDFCVEDLSNEFFAAWKMICVFPFMFSQDA